MKKKTATQSAFFNPRVLVGFAICVIAAFIALFAMARQNDQTTEQQQGTPPSERAQLTALAFDELTDLPQPAAPPAAPVRYDAPEAVFVVNTTADTADAVLDGICADSGGNCSLRAAITEANNTAAADTITLPAGTYITTLAGVDDTNAGGDYDITQPLSINGAGAGTTFLQAAAAPNTGTQRVLHVINTTAVIAVNINDVTIRYGNETTSTAGGGARAAVIAGSVVTFNNCNFDQNRVAPPANNNCFGGALIHSNPTATAAAGTVTMNNCNITNNSAVHTGATVNGFAGGIYNQQGTLNLTNCRVTNNSATSFHGGIRTLASTLSGSTTTLSNCTVSGNTARGINGAGAEGEGGGVTNINGGSFICTTTINSSTISGNSVQIGGVNGAGTAGGGVENVGASTGATNLNMNNSTVSGNTGADGGGGVYSGGTGSATTLNYCTVAANSATSTTAGFGGGGVWHDGAAGTVTLIDSIVGDNTAPAGPDIFGTGVIGTGNYNHIENPVGPTTPFAPAANDVTGSDAGLSTLGGYGGPTFVHMPSGVSPVINTIPNGTNGCGTTFVVDQRGFGFGRPSGGACEKGSVERQPGDGGATPSPTPSQTPTSTATATATVPVPTPTPTPTVTPPATVCALVQGFEGDAIGNILAGGWVIKNQSTTTGTTNWFQGNSTVFPAHQGGPTSYVGANFNATTATNTISDWLFLPPVTIQNGAQISFFTRTTDAPQSFPDRLQVRFSTNGTSTNVGVTATDVGDFTNLMLDINPTYSTTGAYPSVWTQFTATVSGVVGSPKGRIAFRYFVESGGPTGVNSDYIGIDTVGYNCAGPAQTPTPGATATATATATASPVPSPTPTPPVTPTPQPTPCTILYDQNNNTVASAVNSQMFAPADVAFDNQAADDFVVPGGPNWIVQQVVVTGVYFNGNGPAPAFNVYFYNDAAGFPGATVSSQLSLPYTCVGACNSTANSVYTIFLGSNVNLAPGTYWVSVQVAMDFEAGGQWGWADRTVTSNNAATWQNPGGGFATACNTWGRRGATCGIDPANPDQGFQIVGCQVASTFSISGTVGQCNATGPSGIPLDGATVAYAGAGSGSTVTAGGGLYTLSGLAAGSYTVTPSKAARPPGSAGITTTDVIAIQRHFLGLGAPLTGCRLTAADCAAPVGITTGDVIACQRYFLTLTTGIGNVGRYSFTPAFRTYLLGSNQVAQNYDAVVFGDVATPFANPRPAPPGGDAPITPTVEAVVLPEVDGGNGIYEVKTSQINAASNIVGFQGDIQFDERAVTFDTQPVQNAGLTAGNWNVSANIIEGKGPMRTLRVSAYSNDFAPLAGSGTLFALRITPASKTAQGAQLRWAAPPDQFVFIDADSNMHTVGNAALGNLINR